MSEDGTLLGSDSGVTDLRSSSGPSPELVLYIHVYRSDQTDVLRGVSLGLHLER